MLQGRWVEWQTGTCWRQVPAWALTSHPRIGSLILPFLVRGILSLLAGVSGKDWNLVPPLAQPRKHSQLGSVHPS